MGISTDNINLKVTTNNTKSTDTKSTNDNNDFASIFLKAALKDQTTKTTDTTKEDISQSSIMDYFKSCLNTATVKKMADTNNDGKIDDTELKAFTDSIKKLDGDDSSLSTDDMLKEIDKINAQALQDALKAPEMDAALQNASNKMQSVETSPSTKASQNWNAGGQYSKEQVSGASNLANYLEDGGSIEDLQSQEKTLQTEIDKKKEEITNINNGSAEQVKTASDAADQAKQKMDDAVKNDDKIDDETKQEFTDTNDKITENDKALSDNSAETTKVESSITQNDNSIATLESSLSSLAQPTGAKGDEDKDAKLGQRKSDLESQIATKKSDSEKLKQQKDDLASKKTELESTKTDLNAKKEELQAKINDNCSPETKQAIAAYDTAKQNVEKVKADSLTTAQGELSSKVTELNEVDKKLQEKQNKKSQGVDFDFTENMTDQQKADLKKFQANYEQNKDRYEAVAKKTGIPAELIASLHWRESSGNFNTYMQNGDPLGKPTTHVPAGISCSTWEESAIKAFADQGKNVDSNNINTYYDYAEKYNGTGYKNKGVASPYVWAGTTKYTSGKYVADGQYSSTAVDSQLGVAAMLKSIMS